MKQLLSLLFLLTACQKEIIKPQPAEKLTKADAGKAILAGTWWNESECDSLIISVKGWKKDSVYYNASKTEVMSQLTHHINYEMPDDRLRLKVSGSVKVYRYYH